MRKVLHEIDRILTEDGVYMFVSHNTPDVIIQYIDANDDERDETQEYYAWQTEAHQIAKPTIDRNKIPDLFDSRNTYYIYVCIKDEERHFKKITELARREKEKVKAAKKAKLDKMKSKGR